jgi:phosphoglycerate dehydrogenase-like enzyme
VSDLQKTPPAVLILSTDAREYEPLMEGLSRSGTTIVSARSLEEALEVSSRHSVVLGQPDLVAAVIDGMPAVRWVQSSWAGITPLLNVARDDFVLTGIKDLFGPQMAEYVFAYLLGQEVGVMDRAVFQARRSWFEGDSGGLHGKTIGILGSGSIGAHIARVAGAFGMRVLGYSQRGAAVDGFDRLFTGRYLREFLSESDYVVGVLPDTPATQHLLDRDAFIAMKTQAWLINVGRGNLVNEEDLCDALEAGEIAGAILDVFEQEPLPQTSRLWDTRGVVITGHVAAQSKPCDIASIFVENYRRYTAGLPLKYVIDFSRGY